MDRPGFSIVIPTYQRREVVSAAVSALTRIRYAGAFEAIVVVDGSTDGTEEALAGIETPFPLRVISQPNRGAASARNRGAQAATGEVLLFLDDDMIADPEILEQHARSHAEGADAVLGDIPLDPASPRNFLSAGVEAWAAERRRQLIESDEITLFDLLTGQLSVRRAVFDAIGGFDGAFTRDGSFGDEDLDLGLRLIERYRVVFNPDALSYQRYVVGYRAYLRQGFEAGLADAAFARKHPDHAGELFAQHGASTRLARWLLIPLSRVPGLPDALGRLARRAAEGWTPTRSLRNRAIPRLFYLARDLLYWRGVHLGGGIPRDRPLLVLCYHAIADLAGDRILAPYATPPAQFERQIDALLRRGYRFIGGTELAAWLAGRAGLPRRAVLLTFDDCYVDLLSDALPVLAERGIPAVAFAVTGLASNSNEWDHPKGCTRLALLDDAGLREAAGAGIEIGGHSRTHRALSGLDSEELAAETAGTAEDIEAKGLPRPRFFAYPYGDFDRAARDAVEAAGYLAAFTVAPGRYRRASDRFTIPRVEMLRQDTGLRFWLKTALAAFGGRLLRQGRCRRRHAS